MTDPTEAQALDALKYLAAAIGADARLVQGAGGNVSVKVGGTLWIKASGTWLADALARNIMVPVDLPVDETREIAAAAWDGSGLRPSIETSMHAALPHAVVLHVHSVDAIAHAVLADAPSILATKLHGLRWAFVPYCRPGLPLTRAIRAATLDSAADVLVLANHGLVVAAETVCAAESLLSEVVTRLALPPRALMTKVPETLATLTQGSGYHPAADSGAHTLATDPTSFAIATRGILYPDHVVFLGRAPLVVDRKDALSLALRAHAATGRLPPRWIIVRDIGVAVADDLARGGLEMLRCLAEVAARIAPDQSPVVLADDDVRALTEWDAEKYRQQLALAAA